MICSITLLFLTADGEVFSFILLFLICKFIIKFMRLYLIFTDLMINLPKRYAIKLHQKHLINLSYAKIKHIIRIVYCLRFASACIVKYRATRLRAFTMISS